MQIEKKQILKEDGRYLVYYHFPESATPEETEVFAAVREGATDGVEANAAQTTQTEETACV